MASKDSSELTSNRSAFHHYEIEETLEVGVVLMGTEVKSLKAHQGSLKESYVKIKANELWLVGAHIAHYSHGNLQNHEERRMRKLLAHKKEILRLKAKVNEKGLTLVPLGMYLRKGKIKLKLALGRGRKAYDKRQKIKAQESKRAVQRELREI